MTDYLMSLSRRPWRPRTVPTLLAATLLAAGCQKAEITDLENEAKRQVGTWQVTEIKTVTTDSLGVVRSTVVAANQGTMEFRLAADPSPFNLVLFAGPCAGSVLVDYFRRSGAGDATTGGGWSLNWDADPEARRLQFWGIQPGGSLHRVVNLERDGDSHVRLFFILNNARPTTRREIITYDLRK